MARKALELEERVPWGLTTILILYFTHAFIFVHFTTAGSEFAWRVKWSLPRVIHRDIYGSIPPHVHSLSYLICIPVKASTYQVMLATPLNCRNHLLQLSALIPLNAARRWKPTKAVMVVCYPASFSINCTPSAVELLNKDNSVPIIQIQVLIMLYPIIIFSRLGLCETTDTGTNDCLQLGRALVNKTSNTFLDWTWTELNWLLQPRTTGRDTILRQSIGVFYQALVYYYTL